MRIFGACEDVVQDVVRAFFGGWFGRYLVAGILVLQALSTSMMWSVVINAYMVRRHGRGRCGTTRFVGRVSNPG